MFILKSISVSQAMRVPAYVREVSPLGLRYTSRVECALAYGSIEEATASRAHDYPGTVVIHTEEIPQ